MKNTFGLINKPALTALLLLTLTLPACSTSWLADPLMGYLEKKTGLEVRIQETDWSVRPFRVTFKKINIGRHDPAIFVKLSVDRLTVQLGWEFSAQLPFWPRFHVERLEAEGPIGEIRVKGGETGTDWRTWFKKVPAVRLMEIRGFRGEIAAGQNIFRFPSGVDLSGSIRDEYGVRLAVKSGPLKGVIAPGLALSSAGIRGEMEINPAEIQGSWKGRFDLSRTDIGNPEFRLTGVAGSCSFQGRERSVEIRDLEGRLSGIQLNSNGFLAGGEGDLRVRGAISLGSAGRKEEINPALILTLTEVRISLEKGSEQISGQASGDLRVTGTLPRPRLSGTIQVAGVQGELLSFRLGDLRGVIPLEGIYPDLVFSNVTARAADFVWRGRAFPLRLTQPQTAFSARIRKAGEHLSVNDIRLSSREWGTLAGGLEFDRKTGSVPNGKAELSAFPLEKIIDFFPSFSPSAEKLKIPVQGRLSWHRETTRSPWEFRLDLEARGLTQQRNGPRWGIEDLDTRLRARITWDASRGDWSGEGTQRLDRGNLSLEPGILRFNDYPLELDWKGRFKVAENSRLLEGQARVDFIPSGPWDVSGRLEWEEGDLKYAASVSAERVPLAAGYRFWRDQPGEESPVRFPGAEIQGTVAAAFTLVGNKGGGRIRGRLQGADLRAAGADSSWGLGLKKLDLPLNWAYGDQAYPGSDEALIGRLEVGEIKTAWIQTRDLDIPLRALKNRIEIPGTLTGAFGGGNLLLETPVLTLNGGRPFLETGLKLQAVDLSVLFPNPSVAGSLQGDLGRIRLDARRGEAPGSLQADLFDGWLEIRDLAVVNPVSPDRRLQAAVAFDYINLEKVTRLISFGYISGYVQGRVDDLVIQGNLPERFHLTLKTREVAGVDKRINIKAVENVSLLGTGFGEPGQLQKGINRWFQDYAYEEIGLSCKLSDDMFSLRGTIFAGGTEYLVKSPGLYGIDVINRNPENAISFSDMLERLKRIRSKKEPGGSHDGQ